MNHKSLKIYEAIRELAKEVYAVSLKLPVEEKFNMAQQMRRASLSVKLNLAEAREVRRKFHQAYPAFGEWYKRIWAELEEKGYVESLTGRRRHFGDVSLMSRSDRNEALRQAINFLVQSLAADIALIALSCCHQARLPITDFVHDSIGFEFEAGKSQGMLEVISYLMITQPMMILDKLFGVEIGVRLDVEMEVK